MNKDATMNENAGKYQGLDRFEARKQLVKDLENSGFLISIEKMIHSVGHSERTGVMVEPYLSKQWFVKMRPLADRVLLNQKDKINKVNFIPERFEKVMNHWMEITYDWCISRQLWWGHRIPAMNIDSFTKDNMETNYTISEEWILTKLENTIQEVKRNMDKYEFHNVGNILYSFIWEDFCDNYIEVSKANMNNTTKTVLLEVLTAILKMLHPFMPYVTEEIYNNLPLKEANSIMISKYPEYEVSKVFTKSSAIFEKILEDIQNIRNLKAINKITKDAYISVTVDQAYKNIYFSELKIKEEQFGEYKELESRNYKSKYINITYYFEGEKEDIDKIKEDIKNLELSITRREKLLSNENYVNKAPTNVVELDRQKLKEEKEKLESLKKTISD